MWALVDGVKEKVDKSVFLFAVLTFLIYDASACVLNLWCYSWEMCSFMELRWFDYPWPIQQDGLIC
jgi:hypothetical protein